MHIQTKKFTLQTNENDRLSVKNQVTAVQRFFKTLFVLVSLSFSKPGQLLNVQATSYHDEICQNLIMIIKHILEYCTEFLELDFYSYLKNYYWICKYFDRVVCFWFTCRPATDGRNCLHFIQKDLC